MEGNGPDKSYMYGPECPRNIWMDPAVQAARKEEFLQEQEWKILFISRDDDNPEKVHQYLLAQRDGEPDNGWHGITRIRIINMVESDGPIAYVSQAFAPFSILASGRWKGYDEEGTLVELINRGDLYMSSENDESILGANPRVSKYPE